MKASRTRNLIAVLAIALTTLLFTSLFTIADSINYSFQQENFRQMGGDGHGTVKDLSWEQAEELRDDPLIVESWMRLFVGVLKDPPFHKSSVEVSYIEPNGASHYFCTPEKGTLPREGTDEAATDTHVLALLGIAPEIGAKLTLPIIIDDNTGHPQTVERTFTLSGWWDYDSVVPANHVLLPQSAAQEIVALSSGETLTMTGKRNLDILFQNALNIPEKLNTVLEHHGYQSTDNKADNYLRTGVSWAHTASRFSSSFDPMTAVTIAAILLLIVLSGYLIIYNIFQISVVNDIRFYGLLKTIGTTGRQIKRIIRQQAILLSLMGIPLGLILGFIAGNKLTPVIMAQLSYKRVFVAFHPWIFLGAAAFSLATVVLSCARPGRIAAKVSPVEAVRCTEGSGKPRKKSGGRATRTNTGGASLSQMAWANLGRSRSKTVVTILSLTLAVVLLTLTYTFTSGFDMEKYLSKSMVTDFIVGHADQFSTSVGFRSEEQAVPETVIDEIATLDGVTDGGRIYAKPWSVQQFVAEDWLRQSWERVNVEDIADQMTDSAEHLPDGQVAADALLYGMEEFPLSLLRVVEGDVEPLKDPAKNAIAAVCFVDEYGNVDPTSAWAKLGDVVTLRQVSEWGYYDPQTGRELTEEEVDTLYDSGSSAFIIRAKVYTMKDYTVCARVAVPSALSFRYIHIGADNYVLGAEQFKRDTGTENVMIYVYNTTEETNPVMETFLADYTETVQPLYDYESRQTYADQFDGFRKMFLTMGSALSFIIGLVGVLNFINAILTGILTRKREFAVLQSVGMTGKQLQTMLVYEGLYYILLALGLSLTLSLLLGPLAGGTISKIFWFFSYRFTVAPIFLVLPIFLFLGTFVPLAVYRVVARSTIVERLREAET